MKTKPDLGFWKLWNLSFGFFGVQIAYALQSANVSRIFATIGADPHDLSYFWILPPLMGLLVQPIVGTLSDKTWCRFGRRLPYLIFGAAVAVLVMCVLPNAGSFGLTVSSAIIIGLFALMLLDTSINMAMQPFKMLVGDMVNEKQKGLAYSIQSFLCNAGSIVGYVFPFLLTWLGFQSTAAAGVVPQTVVYSFYVGAAILLICVIYSLAKIKEWPPQEYNEYNGVETSEAGEEKKTNIIGLLVNAPSTFWTVGLVQFFCWFAFLFMWTYTTGTVAKQAFNTPSTTTISGIVDGDNTYNDKYILIDDTVMMVDHGKALVANVLISSADTVPYAVQASDVVVNGDTIVAGHRIVDVHGKAKARFSEAIAMADDKVVIDGVEYTAFKEAVLQDYLTTVKDNSQLTLAAIVARDNNTGALVVEDAKKVTVGKASDLKFEEKVVLNTQSEEYNAAGDWVGILFAIQAIGSVIWAVMLPRFRSRKFSYFLSLVLGGVGFISAALLTNQYLLFVSFLLIGCAWAAMLAWPFTILTNSLKGGNIGTYLGLFNCSICLPQIVGALAGGWILSMIGSPNELAPQHIMMIIAGVSLFVGSLCVFIIKEK